jgi:hypothetical protein
LQRVRIEEIAKRVEARASVGLACLFGLGREVVPDAGVADRECKRAFARDSETLLVLKSQLRRAAGPEGARPVEREVVQLIGIA